MKRDGRRRRGSVLLLTLFLISLAAFALTMFIEKAFSEIMAEAHYTQREKLRIAAYSALEATAAVLDSVAKIDSQLYAPEQGWGDPFALGEIQISDELDVRVEFVDEMGKIPLTAASREQMLRLFEYMGFDSIAAEELTEALRSWTSQEEAQSGFGAYHLDYERSRLPYRPPYRGLNSFRELAAIAGFREAFFNEQGHPNELYYQFTSLVSLYQFDQINVNSASTAVLQIWSDVGEHEAATIDRYETSFANTKPYYENLQEAEAALGVPLGGGYGVSTHCIRVIITVSDGVADFVLSTIIAPADQADGLRPPSEIQTPAGEEASGRNQRRSRQRDQQRQEQPTSRRQRGRQPAPAPTQQQDEAVPYPFRFLELRENEGILALNPQWEHEN